MNEFKPGDVVVHPKRGRGIVQQQDGGMLRIEWARSYNWTYLPPVLHDLRRLVVIDPEDHEQIERLAQLLHDYDALREFANPKPPKPDEPTGLGAVVEDADGTLWVRSTWPENDDDHLGKPWAQGPVHRNWLIVDAVRVLSEGVQP